MDRFDYLTEVMIKKTYRALQLSRIADTAYYKPIESKTENVYLEILDQQYATGIPTKAFHGLELPKKTLGKLGWDQDDAETPYIIFMLPTFANPFTYLKESVDISSTLEIRVNEIAHTYPDLQWDIFYPMRGDSIIITTPGGDSGTYKINSHKAFGINRPAMYLLNTNLQRYDDRKSTEQGPLDKNADNSIPRSVGKKY